MMIGQHLKVARIMNSSAPLTHPQTSRWAWLRSPFKGDEPQRRQPDLVARAQLLIKEAGRVFESN